MTKKVLAIVACVTILMSCFAVGFTVAADEAKTVVDGAKWFPCESGRENDPIWEVECLREGCLCQGFDMTAEQTGNSNFLDTVYGADGSLTITRNGNDGDEVYWPRIRTLTLDNYPELDWKVADTLHFDIEVNEGTTWNLYVSVNGLTIKLGREIAQACGVNVDGNSESDSPSGKFVGKLNIQDALSTIAGTSGDPNAASAMAIKNMKKTFIPQLQFFCVGNKGASLTINKLHMSTADDVNGDKCDFVDMGLIFGDKYYELEEDNNSGSNEEDAATTTATPTTTTVAAQDNTTVTTTATPTTTASAAAVTTTTVVPTTALVNDGKVPDTADSSSAALFAVIAAAAFMVVLTTMKVKAR